MINILLVGSGKYPACLPCQYSTHIARCSLHPIQLSSAGTFRRFLCIVPFLELLMQPVSGPSSVHSLSHVWLFVTQWTAAHQASMSITNSLSLLKLMSIKSVMPFNQLSLCHPLLLPSIFPRMRDLFQWVSSLHQVAKVLEFQLQHQSFQWIFRTDFR